MILTTFFRCHVQSLSDLPLKPFLNCQLNKKRKLCKVEQKKICVGWGYKKLNQKEKFTFRIFT